MRRFLFTSPDVQEALDDPSGRTPVLGQIATVHCTFAQEADVTALLNRIRSWYRDRDDVALIASGHETACGLPYAVLEWTECSPDEAFLSVLLHDTEVEDYTVWARPLDQVGGAR